MDGVVRDKESDAEEVAQKLLSQGKWPAVKGRHKSDEGPACGPLPPVGFEFIA